MSDRHTAYWTRSPKPAPPLDMTVCWFDGCENDAAPQQDPRWLGRYCAEHLEILPTLVMEG